MVEYIIVTGGGRRYHTIQYVSNKCVWRNGREKREGFELFSIHKSGLRRDFIVVFNFCAIFVVTVQVVEPYSTYYDMLVS